MNPKSASVLILFLLVLEQTMFQWIVTSLPVPQRKTTPINDIIAGKEFLSLFMTDASNAGSTTTSGPPLSTQENQRQYKSYTRYHNPKIPPTLTTSPKDLTIDSSEQHESVVRNLRSSRLYSYNIHYPSTYSSEETTTPTSHTSEDMKVISVRVSSSIGTSQSLPKTTLESNKTDYNDLQSTLHQVDEVVLLQNSSLPKPVVVPSGANEDYLIQKHIRDSLPQESSYHSVTFHDQGRNSTKPRSVSFSSVIQNLSKNPNTEKHWTAETIERPRYSPNSLVNLKNSLYNYGVKYPRINEETATYIPREIYSDIDAKNLLNGDVDEGYNVKAVEESTPQGYVVPGMVYGMPEKNYEVDEAVSVMSNGRAHGVQEAPPPDNQKVGYVVEGRNFRKYRVEERTSDGFIVGEYGVVSHDDGSLRGVRYTADGTINPRLIYDALMKFLSL